MDLEERVELDQLIAELTAAFADANIEVSIHEQMMSLTASAGGGSWSVVWIAIPAGFFGGFGQLWSADIYAAQERTAQDSHERNR